jgi:hypothetical protein
MEGALAPFHLPRFWEPVRLRSATGIKPGYVTALRISSEDRVDE